MGRWGLALLVLLAVGCAREQPQHVERPDLGIAATFPGSVTTSRYVSATPFGDLDWFSVTHAPEQRSFEYFLVQVANVPDGSEQARTVPQALRTFEGWLRFRFPQMEKVDLRVDQGPGFRYRATSINESLVGGVLVVRRGRLHHAQATVHRKEEPRLQAFLDSFRVQ